MNLPFFNKNRGAKGVNTPKPGKYPTHHVQELPDGTRIVTSTDPEESSMQYYHGPSGTNIVINKEGEISITSQGEVRLSSAAMTVTVGQNADINVQGHCKLSATSLDAQVAGNVSLTGGKTTTLNFMQSLAIRAKNMVFACDGNFVVNSNKFIANADCYLGGQDGAVPASMKGTIDTCGCADTDKLATRVNLV